MPLVPHILVFGSNLAGRHGAGSAKLAHRSFGAITGLGIGRMGDCYAIPTKGRDLKPLPLTAVRRYVAEFIAYATTHPVEQYNVLKIGCGLAGRSEAQIAPMFKNAPQNCHLPTGWREIGEKA